ncbi:lysM domain GPI-anchored protein 2 precursor, LysM-containing receptor protein 1, CEBiP-like 1 [Hibiscus trionum]|uniref:LysM domain GPI-anchored protein 2, LysM-containing receptor protein 1, CEBiP-like 1 n=1 Tax=Hibiscus trionum TaxID=183268 RepID=A0A9W7I290_HIBTR|nr:lysM domain GPI-anchored protein 2 precursor, LysM-containing receptor protein 1, CEBiP-like 1 [Hibiscus trionum]
MGFSKLFITISGLLLALTMDHSIAQTFTCSSPSSCRALVGYTTVNNTNLGAIQTLFNASFSSLLGANGLPPSTPRSSAVPAQRVIRIPIDCVCYNGTGTSNGGPTYTVQPGDGLFHIAAEVFSRLVMFQEIATFNNISDPNLIEVGQVLQIPLPCSCDAVDGQGVVHYAHVVRPNSTLPEIAQEFGTDEQTLGRINGITAQNELRAEQPIDVPLRACNSSVRSDSLDSPLLAANGTNVLTANGCVRCSCDAANNWTLRCEPTQTNRPSRWRSCPSMQCEGSQGLSLGNVTASGCDISTCSYAGYNNTTIFTTLVQGRNSTCSSNGVVRLGLNWDFLFILVLLCFHQIL